jgi:c-di-GMP-binding flagellar brake protein YcgR
MNNRRSSERRPQPRVPVQVRSLIDLRVVPGIGLNLSEGGLLVELPKKLGKLTPSVVLVDLEVGGEPHRLEAVVQRTEEHRGRSRLGLRFHHLGEHQRHALRLHIRG